MARETSEDRAIRLDQEREAMRMLGTVRSREDICEHFGWNDAQLQRVIDRQMRSHKFRDQRMMDAAAYTRHAQIQQLKTEVYQEWRASGEPTESIERGRAALDRNGEVVELPPVIRIEQKTRNVAYVNAFIALCQLEEKILEGNKSTVDLNVNDPSAAAREVDSQLGKVFAGLGETGSLPTSPDSLGSGEGETPLPMAVLGTPEPVPARR